MTNTNPPTQNDELNAPKVLDLRQDAIDLLNQIEKLMYDASTFLDSDQPGKYHNFAKMVEEKKTNVENLELVMCVVAPMKAGKSTIINTIAGQDILPNRSSAMTTLPTAVSLRTDFNNFSKPYLKIDNNSLETLKVTLRALQEKIDSLGGIDNAKDKIIKANYPHLVELLPKIEHGFDFHAKITDIDKIQDLLTDLNDIVRICNVLNPVINPLRNKDFRIPYIYVPYKSKNETDQDRFLGNLTIVDTPGPNEAGDGLELSAVVAEQLKSSSMVIIVLDFTSLNNKAAEDIKQQVQPVIEILGKENLYVLVNKIDQRTQEDPMTTDKVKTFVHTDLELFSENDDERVFEISARRAFCSQDFLSELKENPTIEKNDMKTGKKFAEVALGIDWKEDFEDFSLEKLKKKAETVWQSSGFDTFLEKAINVLVESAAPRSIEIAVNVSSELLKQLKDDSVLRQSAIKQDKVKLESEVNNLNNDINDLKKILQDIKRLNSMSNELKKDSEHTISSLKHDVQFLLNEFFCEEVEMSNSTFWKKTDYHARNLLLQDIVPPKTPLSNFLKDIWGYKSSGIGKFDNEYDAKAFAGSAIDRAQGIIDRTLYFYQKKIMENVQNQVSNLQKSLDKKTNPIIEKARKRLNKSFDVELSLPSPVLDFDKTDPLSFHNSFIGKKTEFVDQGYDEIKKTKRVWWNWLWLFPTEVTEKVKRPNKEVEFYTVSLIELLTQINNSFESKIDIINRDIKLYFDKDFNQRINYYFDYLNNYLGNYKNSLEQAQKYQQKEEQDKQNLITWLESKIPTVSSLIKECDGLREKTSMLKNKKNN